MRGVLTRSHARSAPFCLTLRKPERKSLSLRALTLHFDNLHGIHFRLRDDVIRFRARSAKRVFRAATKICEIKRAARRADARGMLLDDRHERLPRARREYFN